MTPIPRAIRELGYLGFFLLSAVVFSWPIAATLGQPSSVRPDYFQNLWNMWWMKEALLDAQVSPYWTDYLHYPAGISLGRHTLSPLNSLSGALLSSLFGLHTAFNLLLIGHFALAGWTCFLLARYLTGSPMAALLAGQVFSLSPFHYYYLPQINVFSMGFIPLAVLSILETYRKGGTLRFAATAMCALMLLLSSSYYLVYTYIFAGFLMVAGRLWEPRVPFGVGFRRLFVAGTLATVVVVLAGWPVISDTLGQTDYEVAQTGTDRLQTNRTNDVLGFNWLAPPEHLIVSWPTMVGYSTLLLLVLGWRGIIRQRFWLLVGTVFLVLSLGEVLQVGGVGTSVPLPYGLVEGVPVLSMLRKADRAYVMTQLATALLLAFAWQHVSRIFGDARVRRGAWAACWLLIAVELAGVPLQRFEYTLSPYLEYLASDEEIRSVVHLPPGGGYSRDGRYNYAQTVHEKKMPQGFTNRLALTSRHRSRGEAWLDAYQSLSAEADPASLMSLMRAADIDAAILHKSVLGFRAPNTLDGTIVWAPFFLVSQELVGIRQVGPFIEHPLPDAAIEVQIQALAEALGPPIFEDSMIAVFRAAPGSE